MFVGISWSIYEIETNVHRMKLGLAGRNDWESGLVSAKCKGCGIINREGASPPVEVGSSSHGLYGCKRVGYSRYNM